MRTIFKRVAPVLACSCLPYLSYAGPVNINTADAQTLAKELNGIGLAKAQAIVADRKRNGMFQTAADLARVKGVGDRLVVLNKDNIRLSEPSP